MNRSEVKTANRRLHAENKKSLAALLKQDRKRAAVARREKHYRAALKAIQKFMDGSDFSLTPTKEWAWFHAIRRFVDEGLKGRPLTPRKP
jgi:hypothetical protein